MLADDRLGLYNERHEGPIGYEFVHSASVQFGHFEPQLHVVHDFDQLRFPYKFALAAAYDTGQLRPSPAPTYSPNHVLRVPWDTY